MDPPATIVHPLQLPPPWYHVPYSALAAVEWRRAWNMIRQQRPTDHWDVARWLWDEIAEYDDRTIYQLCYRVYENCNNVRARLERRLWKIQHNAQTVDGFDLVSEESDVGSDSENGNTSDEEYYGELPDPDAEPRGYGRIVLDYWDHLEWPDM